MLHVTKFSARQYDSFLLRSEREDAFIEIELKKSYRTHTKVSKPTGAIIRFKQVKDEIMEVDRKGLDVPQEKIMEEYEFDNFFENGAALAYSIAAAFAAEKGITQVYDIGSAMAAQSELFESVGVSYVAVEPHVPSYMHATHVIPQKYPCNLPAFDRTKTMGISRLCVGYLAQDDKTYMSLYNNFEHLLLSAPAECLSEMYELYGNILPVEIPWRDLRRNYYPNYWFYFTRKSVMESFL